MLQQTVSDFSNSLSNVIEFSKGGQGCLLVSSEEGDIVVLSKQQYEHLMITIEFLATTGLFENCAQGSREAEEKASFEKDPIPDLFEQFQIGA